MYHQSALLYFCFLFLFVLSVHGYGEPNANGNPVYQERAMLQISNIMRVGPKQYVGKYMVGYNGGPSLPNIMQNYPAVKPLYNDDSLTRAALSHSTDMANNGCFSHTSCNGGPSFGTRVATYYKCGGAGENIAAGNSLPIDTNNQYVCDYVNSTIGCALDKTSAAGHRNNIMGAGYDVVGQGWFNKVGSKYTNYWTSDFGGQVCPTAPDNAVFSGSHFYKRDSNVLDFSAVYWVSPAVAPSSANLVLNGASYPLTLKIGVAGQGAYYNEGVTVTGCQPYYFSFTSSNGTVYRYPDTGCMVTYSPQCTTSWSSSCTAGASSSGATASSPSSSAGASSSSAATSTSAVVPASSATIAEQPSSAHTIGYCLFAVVLVNIAVLL